jgi:hypothetical protein
VVPEGEVHNTFTTYYVIPAFDDIEIQQYGVSSGNTNVVQTENTCCNTIHAVSNPASFNFSNCTVTINYNGKP